MISSSGVNPSDVKSRSGSRRKMGFPLVIPHSDGAGIIDRVGVGVSTNRVGQRVWTFNAAWNRAHGTAAQYVVLPQAQAVPLPASIDFVAGACLGVPFLTAHRAVFADGSVNGSVVLVQGGAGVVGHYAVQLAKWGGATVLATVGDEDRAAHARLAGADHTINYKRERVVDRVLEITGGSGVDRVVEVEFGSNVADDVSMLKGGGVIATYGSSAVPLPQLPYYDIVPKNIVVRTILVYTISEEARQLAISDLGAWLSSSARHFSIAHRLPLESIAEAHETVERGAKLGHVILDIAGPAQSGVSNR